jgi:hypothetical protein
MTRARLYQPALQRKEEVARARTPAPAVARSSRAARDPHFMRAVDRLQRTTARHALADEGALNRRPADRATADVLPLPARAARRQFSSVLDVQRMSAEDGAVRISSPHDPAEQEAEAIAEQVVTMPAEDRALDQHGPATASAPTAAVPRSSIARRASGPTHASRGLMSEIAAAGAAPISAACACTPANRRRA